MNLQRIIKAVCSIKKISGAQIARDLNLSRQALDWHVHKEADVTLELIDNLAKLYDLDPVEIFSYMYKPLPKKRTIRKTYRPPSFD